jgi:methionyl-tRNA formyltransferase
MSLRIITCNALVMAYEIVAEWAEHHGHQIVLLVTTPAATAARYGASYLNLVELAAPRHPVLVTSKLRAAAPLIAAAQPDLLLSATFPHKLPASVTSIPRLGAFNLHPTPLPQGRGPNPQRRIYEGADTIGATLHQTSAEFDAGAIFSRQEAPLPEELTGEAIFAAWRPLVGAVLEEGMARALAGKPGEPQDETQASYGAPFTPEERWLSWDRPLQLLRKQVAVLAPGAFATLDGDPVVILTLNAEPVEIPGVPPGTVLTRTDREAIVRVQDGVVRVTFMPYEAGDNAE